MEATSQVLNFKANKGISAFNKKELMMVTPIKNHWLKMILSINGVYWNWNIKGKLIINNVFAGVGKPIKLSVCRLSILNFASL